MPTQPAVPSESPRVFDYLNYRDFIAVMLAHLKKSRRGFSLRHFSKQAGFGSHSFLRMIIRGERSLSQASVAKLVLIFGLNARESRYFEALVYYNQSDSESEKDRYFNDMVQAKPHVKMKGLQKDQFEYITKSLFVTIREMSALADFQADPDWIASRLIKPATDNQIRYALEILKRLELIAKGPDGQWTHTGKALQTQPRIESLQIFNSHRTILSESRDIILETPPTETEITSMTIPVSEDTLRRIFEIMQLCREQIISAVNQGSKDFHKIFQVNMQVFPVTKVAEETKDPA